jgi:hypothetical protein
VSSVRGIYPISLDCRHAHVTHLGSRDRNYPCSQRERIWDTTCLSHSLSVQIIYGVFPNTILPEVQQRDEQKGEDTYFNDGCSETIPSIQVMMGRRQARWEAVCQPRVLCASCATRDHLHARLPGSAVGLAKADSRHETWTGREADI